MHPPWRSVLCWKRRAHSGRRARRTRRACAATWRFQVCAGRIGARMWAWHLGPLKSSGLPAAVQMNCGAAAPGRWSPRSPALVIGGRRCRIAGRERLAGALGRASDKGFIKGEVDGLHLCCRLQGQWRGALPAAQCGGGRLGGGRAGGRWRRAAQAATLPSWRRFASCGARDPVARPSPVPKGLLTGQHRQITGRRTTAPPRPLTWLTASLISTKAPEPREWASPERSDRAPFRGRPGLLKP